MDLYEQAIKYLTMREHSRFELEQKLLKKTENKDEVTCVLDKLEKEKFLSDERFCESYLRSRIRKNVEGKQILKMRLKAKGISSQLATEMTEKFFEENGEMIAAAVSKKYQKILSQKGEEKARLMLYQKGLMDIELDIDER